MTKNQIININVPEGCHASTRVSPIKCLKGMDYFRIFSDSLQMLLIDRSYRITDIRVLFYLFSIMDFHNRICISQKDLASDLEMTRPMVGKSLKCLQEKDLVCIVTKIGCQNVYMLNPYFAFKTRAVNLNKLKDVWDEETLVTTANKPSGIIEDGLNAKVSSGTL